MPCREAKNGTSKTSHIVDVDTSNAFVHRHGLSLPTNRRQRLLWWNLMSCRMQQTLLFDAAANELTTDLSFIGITRRLMRQLELNAWDAIVVDVRYHLSGPCWLSACDRLVRNRSEGRVAHLPGDRQCNTELSASPSSQQLLTTWRFVPTKQRSKHDDNSR